MSIGVIPNNFDVIQSIVEQENRAQPTAATNPNGQPVHGATHQGGVAINPSANAAMAGPAALLGEGFSGGASSTNLNDLANALVTPTAEEANITRKYKNSQNARFGEGLMGLGEAFYDIYQGKKLAPEAHRVSQQQAERQQRVDMAGKDQKYNDAYTGLKARFGNQMTDDQIDAFARQAAQDNLDIKDILPDVDVTDPMAEAASLLELQRIKKQLEGLDRDKLIDEATLLAAEDKRLETIRTPAAKDIEYWNKIQNNMNELETIYGAAFDFDESGNVIDGSYDSRGNGAAQIGMLYSFIKGLDPESVVREGETALAQSALSRWQQLDAEVTKFGSPQVLTEEQLSEMYQLAKDLNAISIKQSKKRMMWHYDKAKSNDVDQVKLFGQMLWDEVNSVDSDTEQAASTTPIEEQSDEEAMDTINVILDGGA